MLCGIRSLGRASKSEAVRGAGLCRAVEAFDPREVMEPKTSYDI